jgi:quercetin dioxygenase-like cupin family protein
MIHAFKLYTRADGASHVAQGSLRENAFIDVIALRFEESPPHSALDWHTAPQRQYVVTLSGTLQFETRDGETFLLRPGDVLVAEDDIGTGHKWSLIGDEPWRRAYVVLPKSSDDGFVAQ